MTRRTTARARSRILRTIAGWASALAIGAAVIAIVVAGLGDAGHNARPAGAADGGEVAPSSAATATPGTGANGDEDAGQAGDPASEHMAPPASGTALELLATLPVKGRAPKTGYDRTVSFGTAWLDVDRNGCDTRNDILARDLAAIDRPGGCRVLSGVLVDPYTGGTVDFVRGQGTSQAVQIDHVVSLSNAWQTGAQALSFEERVALANDPRNLLAVEGRATQQKGDGDAATWLPPNKSFRCEFVARQVTVKAAHGLWVTPPEHAAIERILVGCPGQAGF